MNSSHIQEPTARVAPVPGELRSSGVRKAAIDGIRVVAAGDLMLGDSAIGVGFGLRSRFRTGGQLLSALGGFTEFLRRGDVVFGNLETSLSQHGLTERSWRSVQMRGRPEYASALASAGFNVLSVANNHAVQHGTTAFRETIELLERAGIAACGVRGAGSWCAQPVTLRPRPGLAVGMLAYCLRPRQYDRGCPPYAEGSPDEICADVARLRARADYVVVSLHWGEEFVALPSASEVALAHRIAEAGASVILGHHPHVARPIEVLPGAVIAYSLGNFISDMTWQRSFRRGLVLECTLDRGIPVLERLHGSRVTPGFEVIPDAPAMGIAFVPGLSQVDYAARVRATVRRARLASYVHALTRLHRYQPRILVQLVANTIRNRISAQ